MKWFVAAQVGALLLAPPVSAAQGDGSAERLRVLDAVMRFRMEWLGDSTRFDACAAAAAAGPSVDPRSRAWATLPLLDRAGAPCEASRRETAPSRVVLARMVTTHGASAELVATVRVGLRVHQEAYSLVRTDDAWEVRGAQLSRLSEAVRLLAPGGRPGISGVQPLVVLDGVVQEAGSTFSGGVLRTPSGQEIRAVGVASLDVLGPVEAMARFGAPGRNGALVVRLQPQSPATTTVPVVRAGGPAASMPARSLLPLRPRRNQPGRGAHAVAAIITNQTRYVVGDYGREWHLAVVATYTNRSRRTVYAAVDGGGALLYQLQKLERGGWRRALAPVVLLADGSPRAIRPGEVRTDTLRFTAYKPGEHGDPQFVVEPAAGVYRVTYDLYARQRHDGWTLKLSQMLAPAARSSNPFRLDFPGQCCPGPSHRRR